MQISDKVKNLVKEAEKCLEGTFSDIDETSLSNTEHVLDVFRSHGVSESFFMPTTGYGYGDRGRDEIDSICADVFGAEKGIMRHNFISGTHAITVGLFALLRPGDIMLSITGLPYDTLHDVIGIDEFGREAKNGSGSLADFGVGYRQVDLLNGEIDYPSLEKELKENGSKIRVVYLQRSKGYVKRPTLSVREIKTAVKAVHEISKKLKIRRPFVAVDNCYGEFCETSEPCLSEPGAPGADMIIGSLIKNPGGGMADCGGYIAGTEEAVTLAGNRLCCPGVGLEAGASLGQNRNILRGLFLAPHVVAGALKTAHLAAYVFSSLGYEVYPSAGEKRFDIIQTVDCRSADGLVNFCRGIQSASPIDSCVSPEPWAMPGYADEVVMAAGAFVGGSSIELSCDGPMKEPYTAFMQGGLTYEAGKLAVMSAAEKIISQK